MAETYIKGSIVSTKIVEGDTDKGHWVRQECVIRPDGGGRQIHFQLSGQDRIQVAGLQVGQSYVVRLFLESREGKDKDGNPIWFDSFVYGGTFTEAHSQYFEECLYNMRSPRFVQNYQMVQRGYGTAGMGMGQPGMAYGAQQYTQQQGAPQGYQQQQGGQNYQQGYGSSPGAYGASPQPGMQGAGGGQGDLPF